MNDNIMYILRHSFLVSSHFQISGLMHTESKAFKIAKKTCMEVVGIDLRPILHLPPREEVMWELQTTRLSIEMVIDAHFHDHNPRRSAIWRKSRQHFRLWIL